MLVRQQSTIPYTFINAPYSLKPRKIVFHLVYLAVPPAGRRQEPLPAPLITLAQQIAAERPSSLPIIPPTSNEAYNTP